MKHTPPITVKLDDEKAEQVRRNTSEKLVALQSTLFAGAELATGTLANGVNTPVPHKLGKRPSVVMQSVIRGAASAGVLTEVGRDERFITLNASGFGATITVDLVVA